MGISPGRALDHRGRAGDLSSFCGARQPQHVEVIHGVVADRIAPPDQARQPRIALHETPRQEERGTNVFST
jgi:hypothetical protein